MDDRPFRAASLAERTRRSPAATVPPVPTVPTVPPGLPATTTGTSSTRRHCWVDDGAAGRRAAGLLVEWRQLGGAWQGRVAYVVDEDGEATLVEAWLPASQLRRADDA